MNVLKPNEQRSKTAILLIWIVLFIEIVSSVFDYFQLNLLQSVLEGQFISDQIVDSNDNRQQIISILFLIVYIISAITFIQWFRRAYFNLHILVKKLTHTEGWAAGAWFVPIISLFRPYQIMIEMSEKTEELISNNDLNKGNEELANNSIGIWWALWIINNIIGQVSFRFPSDTVEQLMISTSIDMYSILIKIPLAYITVKVIKDYCAMERLLVNLPKDNGVEFSTEDNVK